VSRGNRGGANADFHAGDRVRGGQETQPLVCTAPSEFVGKSRDLSDENCGKSLPILAGASFLERNVRSGKVARKLAEMQTLAV
jgi:hypothetical protein